MTPLTPAGTPSAPTSSSRRRFLANVVWSWGGVAVNILVGLLLSPILVRRLGAAQYGVWVLLFSTMEYLRLLDFGFRAAVINRCARHRARGEWTAISETINTALIYFLLMSGLCVLAAVAGRDLAMRLFRIDPALQADARVLMILIAVSISARLVLSGVTGTLEAFQRFDLINRAYIASLTVRAVGSLALLLSGYGLVALGALVLCVQVAEDVWNLISLKRVFPQLRFSPRLVRADAFKGMIDYGKHSSLAAAANLIGIQAPATVLGLVRGPLDVAFFSLPWRLLMYTTEAFAKVGQITSSVAADLDARDDRRNVAALAIQTNRHCLALFMPLAIFLALYGTPLLTVWVTPEFGRESGPLLPILVIPFLFAIAGQFNSSAVLIGQAKHGPYSIGIVVEVVAMTAALFLVAPRYGAFGAACVVAAALMLNRAVYLAILMCRMNGLSLGAYVTAIYARPLIAAVPALAVGAAMRFVWLPGRNWFELIAALALISGAGFAVSFLTVLDRDSRRQILSRVPGGWRATAV